ncbi:MAG: hypothetical protein ACKO47_05610 [Alphaproteobacteria bacterium]
MLFRSGAGGVPSGGVAGSALPPPQPAPPPQLSTTLPGGLSADPDTRLITPAPRRLSSGQGPNDDSDSDSNTDYLHPPTKFLNQKASEMKRKSQKAKENFNKNLRRAVGLGLLSVIIGIGVFSPFDSAGNTLIKLIASQAPIAVGFTALGLILPVLGMVYCGVKAIKNNQDKVSFKKGSESITIESQLYDLNKGKNPEKVEDESKKWQDRIEKAKSRSRSSSLE